MNWPNQGRWAASVLLMCLAGCAQFAIRPPTPAKDLVIADLEEPQPGEHYYLILWASQGTPARPRYTHSWATVIHLKEQGPAHEPQLEVHTISWLPASLEIQPLYFHPVKPVNLGPHESIRWALGTGQRVSEWGPYELRPRAYVRFLVQKEFLESGQIGYQCTDTVGEAARRGNACDCIHAITDMDPEYPRSRYPLIWFGDSATRIMVERVMERGALIHPEVVHDWLDARLGLNDYPIVHRTDTNPGLLFHLMARVSATLSIERLTGSSGRQPAMTAPAMQ